jgi:hypothetical protein
MSHTKDTIWIKISSQFCISRNLSEGKEFFSAELPENYGKKIATSLNPVL